MDLMGGIVVHGVMGRREEYMPVSRMSKAVSTSDPLKIVDELRPKELYIADLDRILGRGDNLGVIRRISRRVRTMADIGVRSVQDLRILNCDVIAATETADLGALKTAEILGNPISVDTIDGTVVASDENLSRDPVKILDQINPRKLLLLQIDRVGVGGMNFELVRDVREAYDGELLVGGGVGGAEDLEILEKMGVNGVILSSAIHLGRLGVDVLW